MTDVSKPGAPAPDAVPSAPTAGVPTPSRHGNPGPRPALRRRADAATIEAARPGVGVPPVDLALQGDTTEHPIPAPGGPAPTPPREPKQAKKRKNEKKRRKVDRIRADREQGATPEDRSLTVPLPKHVRKALIQAANEHGTTPEHLVALVLSEWLDH